MTGSFRLATPALAMTLFVSIGWAEPPALISPRQSSALGCPTFSWGGIPDAEGYDLVVYRVRGDVFSAPAVSVEDAPVLQTRLPRGATTWSPSAAQCLTPGGQYAWAVRETGGDGDAWSEPVFFEVAEGPSIPEVEAAIETLRQYLEEDGATPPAGGKTRRADEPSRRGALPERHELREHGSPVKSQSRKLPIPLRRDVDGASALTALPSPSVGSPSLTLSGSLALGVEGNVYKQGQKFLWDDSLGNTAVSRGALVSVGEFASYNTAVGRDALQDDITGDWNTAVGVKALPANIGGSFNTAIGIETLYSNTSGNENTAVGAGALVNMAGSANTATGFLALAGSTTAGPTSGVSNTADGHSALYSNTTGYENAAVGRAALYKNTTGFRNTAVGGEALWYNVSGNTNTASGWKALRFNTEGYQNTAAGGLALFSNTIGDGSAAFGHYALHDSTTGDHNTAVGDRALRHNTTGSGNIAIGHLAGDDAPVDTSDSIYIGSPGLPGVASPSVFIGEDGVQTSAWIAGIYSTNLGSIGSADVRIQSDGKLGVDTSSRRFKEEIRDLDDVGDLVARLRPVRFRYRPELVPDGGPEIGLIAEEVAELFPELVSLDAEGRPFAVRYDLLSVLLLAELQKAEGELQDNHREIGEMRERLRSLEGRPPTDRRASWWRRLLRRGSGSSHGADSGDSGGSR